MKKSPFQIILLLICAILLVADGLLHPCIHAHDYDHAQAPTGELHAASGPAHAGGDDSFCPICSGNLMTTPVSTGIQTAFLHPEIIFQFSGEELPLYHGDSLRHPRAPPAA